MKHLSVLALTLGILFSSSVPSFAAEGTEGKAAVGIVAGVNFGNASTPSQIGTDTRTGYAFGLNVDIGLGSIFSLQPELLYVQQGSTLIDKSNVRVRTSYQSLQLPVLLKARIGEWKAAPYVFAGPVATFHLGRSADAEVGGATAAFTYKPKQWDFGVAMGVGVDIGPVFGSVRYNLGLVNTNESGGEFKSRGFMILAGLRL